MAPPKSRIRKLYREAFIQGHCTFAELRDPSAKNLAIRLPSLRPEEKTPTWTTIRAWKSRDGWDSDRAKFLEAASVVVADALPSLDEQYELIQKENPRKLPTLAERLEAIAPEHIKESILVSMADGLQLSSSRLLALYDARIEQLVSRISKTESSKTWQEVADEVQRLKAAFESGSDTDQQSCVDSLLALVSRGNRDEHNWAQICKLSAHRAQIAKQEAERLRLGQSYVDVQEAMAIASEKLRGLIVLVKKYGSHQLVSAVREYISGTAT